IRPLAIEYRSMPRFAVCVPERYNRFPAMGDPSPNSPPTVRPQEGRLDSWKEIAAYLNRDVTTVQRWEKREGMPVHRHLHERAGSVFAFRADLDAWMCSRNLRAIPDNGTDVSAPN